MADIKTNVVISARTDDLRSGMAAAASSVATATETMRTQLAALGATALQAQADITAATVQIADAIEALQTKTANLAGSITGGFLAGGKTPQRDLSYAMAAGDAQGQAAGLGNAAVRGGAAQARIGAWRTALQQQLITERSFFSDSVAEELAFWQQKLVLTKTGSKEQAAVEKTIYDLEKRQAQTSERDQENALGAQMRIVDTAYSRKKAAIANERALGKISSAEALAQEQALVDAKWAADQAFYGKKLAAAQGDSKTQEQVNNQEAVAYQAYLTEKEKLTAQAAEQIQNSWKQIVSQISDAFTSFADDVIMRTKSIGAAFEQLVKSLLKDTLQSALKSVFSSLLGGGSGSGGGGGLSSLLFGSAGLGGLLGLPSGGLSGLLGLGSGALLGSLFGGGSAAFAGSAAAMSADLGAIGTGAAASGGLFGWLGSLLPALPFLEHGGIIPSAAGGWTVPAFANGGILSLLHANEMVLPANISQGFQDMFAGEGGGGDHYHFHSHSLDPATSHKMFMSNAHSIVAAFNKGNRLGSPGRGR